MMKNNNKNETNQLGQIINSFRWGELQRNTTAKPLGKKQGFKVQPLDPARDQVPRPQ